jgi:branched-chain amino acid aminotransferase
MAPTVVPPSTTFAWDKLAFGLYPTNGYASLVWSNGTWGPITWVTEPYLKLHVGSGESTLHLKSEVQRSQKLTEVLLHSRTELRRLYLRGTQGVPSPRRPGQDLQVSLSLDLVLEFGSSSLPARPLANAARLNHSASIVSMPDVPEELFLQAINLAVARNLELVPAHAPYGTSGSMYVRPLYVSALLHISDSPS